jgi:hypothetical protein
MKKIEPAVMTLGFVTSPSAGGVINNYVDLSQVASLVNRRFYRQGLNWAVGSIKILGISDSNITVSKLPNTWVMSNSWEKGFRSWQKMNNEALAEAESVKPKFLDFKIYADSAHHDLGFAGNLLPIDAVGNIYNAGEWESSKFVVPTGGATSVSSREVIAVGANYPGVSTATGLNALSLIEGYAAGRALPDIADPNVPDDAADADGLTPENWMTALFNEGTEQSDEVLGDMITENNIAPYPFENDGTNVDTMYPGGANQAPGLQIHDNEKITTTTIGGITRIKGGNFPCGLMKFTFANLASDGLTFGIQIDLVPGNHRGYLCEPMTEM